MEFIRGLVQLKPEHKGCVLTIGNFDGVHRGHQAIINQLNQIGQQINAPSTLLTFEPLPREVLNPATAPVRLTRLREKLCALRNCPIDRVLCVRFDPQFAMQSPQQFVSDVLLARLGVRAIVAGDDFRFGHRGSGDINLLREMGARHDFQVIDCARFELYGRRVSSSWVRESLEQGNLALTTELLGRTYNIQGRVAHGDQLGRTLGFPTANIRLLRSKSPLSGVFAVRVHGIENHPLPGVAYVGKRPTVNGVDLRLEVFLFDFTADIYGTLISIELPYKIRDDIKFPNLDTMRAQIQQDAERARELLKSEEQVC